MDLTTILIALIILLFSAILHEIAHGAVADRLGDHTARIMGRLTLNPIPHLDLFGSILLPLFLFLVNSPILFGAAKPVPVNFFNLRNPKRDMALVSLAGPATNFLLAIFFAIPIRFNLITAGNLGYQIILQAIIINLILGVFNLLPLPPLDGSKVVASFLPDNIMYRILSWERYGFIIIIAFLYLGLIDTVLVPIMRFLSQIILDFSVI